MVYFHRTIVSLISLVKLWLALRLAHGASSYVTTSSINSICVAREKKCASCTHLSARRRGRKKSNNVIVQNIDSHDEETIATNDHESFEIPEMPSRKQPNRRERMAIILDRDGRECLWCRKSLSIETATTDHLMPRIKGGPSWVANELAACRKCNKQRGHMLPLDWLEQCEDRGLHCNRKAVERCLVDLDREVLMRGGQRRMRPYLARQLRRLNAEQENR